METPGGIALLKKKYGEDSEQASKAQASRDRKMQALRSIEAKKEAKKAFPGGELAPARLDADGNEVKPALTYESYYAGTNKKHFYSGAQNEESMKTFLATPGSQFDPQKVSSLQHLVALTAKERRGGLKGDDRKKLVQMGADPRAFSDGYQYPITPAGGHLGSTTSSELENTQRLSFHEKIPGSNIISITVEKDSKPKVDYGVLILAKQDSLSPDNPGSGGSVVVTAHPGPPSRANVLRGVMNREEKDAYDQLEHDTLRKMQAQDKVTVANVRKMKKAMAERQGKKLLAEGRINQDTFNVIVKNSEEFNVNVTTKN